MSGRVKRVASKRTGGAPQRADSDLPIFGAKAAIVEAINSRKIKSVLIVGETGSGKSTQVVQFLLEAGYCGAARGTRCVITQPRRVAVTTVCGRVSAEVGCDVGERVGYAMRFENRSGPETAVKFTTDGYLVRECVRDPLLADYNVVILDEVHERSVETDVLCGLCKRAARARRKGAPLKIVAMSATLDVDAFRGFFDQPVEVIRVPGRLYPVHVFYCKEPQDDFIDAAAIAARQLHRDKSCVGDVLVFMPGQEEIAAFVAVLRRELGDDADDLKILPLFAALAADQQLEVFAPCPVRKVVVATTIAETSVTISGVRHVIDPGLVKARRFSAATGFEALEVVPTSKAQARQRAGRAGREAPGTCYRLYPETEFFNLDDETVPEIERSDLASVVLQLKAMGVDKPEAFDFVTKPPRDALLRALELLFALRALDGTGAMTSKGDALSRFPLSPLLANLVLETRIDRFADARTAVVDLVALLAAAESVFAPGATNEAFVDRTSDLLTELNAYRAFKLVRAKRARAWCDHNGISHTAVRAATRAADQISAIDDAERRRLGLQHISDHDDAGRETTLDCLVSGLCAVNAALRDHNRKCFRTCRGKHDVYVHPSSVLHGRNPPPDAVIFASCVVTNKRYVRGVTAVPAIRLPSLAPAFFATKPAPAARVPKPTTPICAPTAINGVPQSVLSSTQRRRRDHNHDEGAR
ncbi:hypothetical protein CTAYLR_002017 [Chrysophaeum taylorii]|uniref:RNA helicase n=1 Tax=Chrysophaeum taylorii TaxID=2483200 RepID=A0AAD7U8P0_9STRA|nr:hypothetical protein CTAYLR_002017 [Chrysophaeum taylorii]